MRKLIQILAFLANPDRAVGGHLEAGTSVFTFAVVSWGCSRTAWT